MILSKEKGFCKGKWLPRGILAREGVRIFFNHG